MPGLFTTQTVSILPATQQGPGATKSLAAQIQGATRGTDVEQFGNMAGRAVQNIQDQVNTIMNALRSPLPFPDSIGITDPSGALIGWVGFRVVNGSVYEGGWFKQLYVGGNDPTTAPLFADAIGDLILGGKGTGTPYLSVQDNNGIEVGRIGAALDPGPPVFSGAWFQELRVGGSGISAPVIASDAVGNVTINGATFTLDANGITTSLNNSTDSIIGVAAGTKIADNVTNDYSFSAATGMWILDGSGNLAGSFHSTTLLGVTRGILTLKNTTTGTQVILDSLNGTVSIGTGLSPNRIITTRQTGPGTPAFAVLADAQTWCSNLLTALRAHGLVT